MIGLGGTRTFKAIAALLGRGSTQSGAFPRAVNVKDLDGVLKATIDPITRISILDERRAGEIVWRSYFIALVLNARL